MDPRFSGESTMKAGLNGFNAPHVLLHMNALPLYVACASLLLLLLQSVYHAARNMVMIGGPLQQDDRFKYNKIRVPSNVFWFMVARFLGCLALFGLSITTVLQQSDNGDTLFSPDKWRQLQLPVAFFYASLLSSVSLSNPEWRLTATRHLNSVLLTVFGVYAYRDFWPLMTTNETPQDINEGSLLWMKLAIISFIAVVIPLFIPRIYVPIDPSEPMDEPNPEQTASLFSKYLYFYMDALIFKASKVEHLPYNDLEPLPDYDRAQYLREKGFPHLDTFSGAKQQHLFFRLLRVYRTEYITLSMSLVFQVIANFGAPIGINRVLSYLEHGPEGSNIRPWFWVAWILIGPMAFSISRQSYIFINTHTLVRAESLITQLVFEHSLRLRLKAETSETESTPATTSNDGTTTPEAGSEQQTAGSAATKANNTRADNMIGKMNNLVTSDLNSITGARDFLIVVFYAPLQIATGIFFLYVILGISAFVGLAVMVVLMPVPQLAVKKLAALGAEKMKMTDARVQAVSQTVNSFRMVKMFAWESKMSDEIQEKRKEELTKLWRSRLWETVIGVTNHWLSTFITLSTFGFYTMVMKGQLSASIVFSCMPVFDLIHSQLNLLSSHTAFIVRGKVSLDRLNEFLHNTELLDTYTPSHHQPRLSQHDSDVIGFQDCSFSWSNENDGTSTPSFRLRIDGQLTFKKGCINLITGQTGAGKTSMLMALLGEMHFIPTTDHAWFNLPRRGGVAYASQESWVQNDTIRNNIVFGSAFDEDRYNKVIRQCALKQDLELFDAGDQTEVGERGLTLSGGQKARITLARAVYSSAEILLLDDILAALDAHTSRWIVEKCLLGDLIQGRTILLVTHNVQLAKPIAHILISIGLEGGVSVESLAPLDHLPRTPLIEVEDTTIDVDLSINDGEKEANSINRNGKLVVTEEVAKGRVSWKAMKLFLSALGGKHPIFFFAVWLSGNIVVELVHTFVMWYLGYWGSQYEKQPLEVNSFYYLSIYALLLGFQSITECITTIYYTFANMRASGLIHSILVGSILGTTLRWLDETPVSRIITRCTQDIGAVDNAIGQMLGGVATMVIASVVKLSGVVIVTPAFLVPGVITTLLGIYTASVYIKAQLSVKRETSNAKAPLLAHFGATVAGLVSVRAYGAQEVLKRELQARSDHYTRVNRVTWDLNRWMSIRMDLIGALFTSSLALYLVLTRSASAAVTGFSLAMALDFCNLIIWLVRLYNELEVQSNSLERIQSYLEIEQEKRPTEAGKPPAAWPTSGELRVEKLSARYSANGPEVLHQLTFQIRSGERIGVVGRTGSGKSTLALALLRCILTEGHVYYDGISTDQINLDALRSSITIIPQVPELLSGTLRKNLDPFGEHEDAELNSALKYAGLFSLQSESDEVRFTLDTKIASGGNNLSVGQRQIIALARAMVRESKLLILDEATSAIDYKTDTLIQDALRHKLGSDVTVITIAHRLQTIMDSDKIMVLDAGNLVEIDTPTALLQKEGGVFKGLVDNSGDAATLRAVAFASASK